MIATKYAVIDTSTNITLRINVKGKSPSEVLARYNQKDWVQRLGLRLEVMTMQEFVKTALY